MNKILVTGGAGYIGSVLVGHLLRQGYCVTVLDNLLYGQSSLLPYCTHPNFDFVRGDVRNESLVRELLLMHDTIFPLAAVVGAPACDLDPYMARAVNLDAILLLNSLRSPDHKVIFPCTNSGYGTKSKEVYCTEETPLEPISLYGRTKVQAEQELLSGRNTISLRLATVFGPSPRMRLDLLVNDFVYRAVTDGFLVIYEKHFKRNFVHIEDVSECFCFCIKHFEEMRGEAYNLGLDEANLSKEELVLKIKQHVPGLYVHYGKIGSDPDKRNYVVSNEKLRNKGFVARHSLDEGIKQLLKAYSMLPRGNFYNV